MDLSKKLANGIIVMQEKEGSFKNWVDLDDSSVYTKFVIEYYGNEVVYILAKLYGITKDEKYIQAKEKALDNFVENY